MQTQRPLQEPAKRTPHALLCRETAVFCKKLLPSPAPSKGVLLNVASGTLRSKTLLHSWEVRFGWVLSLSPSSRLYTNTDHRDALNQESRDRSGRSNTVTVQGPMPPVSSPSSTGITSGIGSLCSCDKTADPNNPRPLNPERPNSNSCTKIPENLNQDGLHSFILGLIHFALCRPGFPNACQQKSESVYPEVICPPVSQLLIGIAVGDATLVSTAVVAFCTLLG